MSIYDRKALVILSILWELANKSSLEKKDVLMHRIQQVMVYYKIGIKRKDYRWIKYVKNLISLQFLQFKEPLNNETILVLIFFISEHYRKMIKNNQRLTAWESLENFTSDIVIKGTPTSDSLNKAENLYESLIEDNLYLQNK